MEDNYRGLIKVNPGICPDGLKKNTKGIRQNSHSQDRN